VLSTCLLLLFVAEKVAEKAFLLFLNALFYVLHVFHQQPAGFKFLLEVFPGGYRIEVQQRASLVKVLGEYARLQAVASGRYVAATKAPAAPANTTARSGPEKSKVPVDQPA
jgi:hypothetical protein